MGVNLDVGNSAYFLRIGSPNEDEREKTVAKGVKVFKSEDAKDADEKIWGHLSFFDQISKRQRIITVTQPPNLSEKEIVCLSDTGDQFHFSYLTKQLWDEKVSKVIKIPHEVEGLLSDTKTLQAYMQHADL
ncbi:MAG: hypothetical protein WB791_03620 [Waddliaceae bacterium]